MIGPKVVDVDGQRYDYKRRLLEILECQTCTGVFLTHVPTGKGQLLAEKEDSVLCAGCNEIMRNLEITERDYVLPS
jgi:hypothetical protein